MAKLDTGRMANSTMLNKTDDAHVALEADLETILGVPDNTVITAPIFGETLDGTDPVNPDGSIKGVMKMVMGAPSGVATSCVGFEFTDGTTTKRMIFLSGGLKIFEYDDTDDTWSQVADLEVGSGSGLLQKLTDCADIGDLGGLGGSKGFLIAVNTAEDSFELIEPATVTGVDTFAAMTDTPAAFNGTSFNPDDAGKLVAVAVGGASTELIDPPTGAGEPFMMWLVAPSPPLIAVSNWGDDLEIDCYQWDYVNVGDDGGLLTDDDTLLTDDGGPAIANKFITLEKGVYEISFWYSTSSPNKYGIREWWVVGTNAKGPAALGANDRAPTYWNQANDGVSPKAGIHSMGTRNLIMIADGTIKFVVYQNSGTMIPNNTFSVTIHRVK